MIKNTKTRPLIYIALLATIFIIASYTDTIYSQSVKPCMFHETGEQCQIRLGDDYEVIQELDGTLQGEYVGN